jgi:hypothetical protein
MKSKGEKRMKEKRMVPGTKIPVPNCKLVGEDGNAFYIMGRVVRALKSVKVPKEVIDKYMEKSMSGDYDNLLRVAMEYIEESGDDE